MFSISLFPNLAQFKSAALACIWASFVVFCSSHAQAKETEKTITNTFYQMDLREAVDIISATSGVNIVVDPSIDGLVTAKIEALSVLDTLDLLLAGTGYQIEKKPHYIVVYDPDASSQFFNDIAETRIVPLSNISASSVFDLLPYSSQFFVKIDEDSNSRLIVKAPSQLADKILEDIKRLDIRISKTKYLTLKYISAETVVAVIPSDIRPFVKADPLGNIVSVSAPAQIHSAVVQQIRGLDIPPKGLSKQQTPIINKTNIYSLSHVTASDVSNLIPQEMAQFIKVSEETNRLTISAPDPMLGELMNFVRSIDVPRKHVYLDARIVVMDRRDVLNIGGNLQPITIQGGVNFSSGSPGGRPWEVAVGYARDSTFTNALKLTLNMMSQNDEATIVANPKIVAQDGLVAKIEMTKEEYYRIEGSRFGGADLQQIETGTILNIVPQIGRDNAITLKMNIEVSDVIARGENSLPVISRRNAQTVVKIEDGGTAAIGGLVDSRTEIGSGGLPGAINLPILGKAFSEERLRHSANQVAIFVTANTFDPNLSATQARPYKPSVVDIGAYRIELQRELNRFE